MKKTKKRYISLFAKSVMGMLVLGIIPFLLMGTIIYNAYAKSIQTTLLENLSQMALYVGKNTSSIFDEMEENTQYIYKYGITEYDYFYELMEDTEVSETKRTTMINDVLRNILLLNQYIDHVMFVTADGTQYSCMRSPEIMVNEPVLTRFHEDNYQPGNRDVIIIPTHDTSYYYYSKLFDFSVARNIMNTRSIQDASLTEIGTLYLDISVDYLTNIISEVDLGKGHEVMIVDKTTGVFVYNEYDYNIGRDVEDIKPWLQEMNSNQSYLKADSSYLIYSEVPGTDWLVIDKVDAVVVESSYQSIRNITLLLLGLSAVLLGVIYIFYSRIISRPMGELKQAMDQIQEGHLDTRVSIASNDEVGILAEGLNQMTENLQNHIRRVYLAELNQKSAQLEALKTQIQPHYLYNMLDVIRMSAITNDDNMTAEMLQNLSAQLKYLIGTSHDRVHLKSEVENIRNYFNLIRIRYDNRFELEIDIPDHLLNAVVPQLILQPIVENAVNHGLKPKESPGRIAIYAKDSEGALEIRVLDNGIGMSEESLSKLQELLLRPEPGKRTDATWDSIGIKNVHDRIKLLYGSEYGLEVSSYEGTGTMVVYLLPIVMEEEGHV